MRPLATSQLIRDSLVQIAVSNPSSLHRKSTMLRCSHIKINWQRTITNFTHPKTPFHPVMVDPSRELALTASRSALRGQQRDARVSVSINSSYSSPQVPAPFYHAAPHPALSFPSELSQTRPPGSHRRLPIPPVHVSRSPSASTSSTSPSSLSPPTQRPTSRRQSVFVV